MVLYLFLFYFTGAIDGTHIRIDRPEVDPDSYINRKQYCSIQMQALVNEKKKFLDVFIGYPGSVHDARVFKESSLFQSLPELCTGKFYYIDYCCIILFNICKNVKY